MAEKKGSAAKVAEKVETGGRCRKSTIGGWISTAGRKMGGRNEGGSLGAWLGGQV